MALQQNQSQLASGRGERTVGMVTVHPGAGGVDVLEGGAVGARFDRLLHYGVEDDGADRADSWSSDSINHDVDLADQVDPASDVARLRKNRRDY